MPREPAVPAPGAAAGRAGRDGPGGGETERDGSKPGGEPAVVRGWGPAQGRATTTLLLRHGETALSTERRFAGRGDIPLTGAGLEQAAAAAARLAARGGIDVIVTSPLRRARQTAEAVARATGAPLQADDGLAETDFGRWEGLTFAEASARWPDAVTAWLASADVAPPGGESFAAVGRRVNAAVDRLLAAHRYRTLLLVSHVTPIKTVLRHALDAGPSVLFRLHLDLASVSIADFYPDTLAAVHLVNDTSHLS